MTGKPIIPEAQALSIVVVGRFNPVIFQPFWFSSQGILTESEAAAVGDETSLGVVHPDVTIFSTEWFSLDVNERRFVISTGLDAYFDRLREFVFLTFQKLGHTPVAAVGFNPEAHVRTSGEDQWNAFGHRFAPKEDWIPITNSPGLRELIIEDKPRKDGYQGYTQYKILPSVKVPYGIFIQMNDHYDFDREEGQKGTAPLLNILENGWKGSMDRWQKVYNHLSSLI